MNVGHRDLPANGHLSLLSNRHLMVIDRKFPALSGDRSLDTLPQHRVPSLLTGTSAKCRFNPGDAELDSVQGYEDSDDQLSQTDQHTRR
jgi:hypothetical protein